VVEPSLVSVGTATMIHCRRCCCWWCVQDVRLKIAMHRCDVWTCMSAANACWIVLCKCMLDIKCSVLRGWSCAITKSFEFWLRTVEKMGLTLSLSHHIIDPSTSYHPLHHIIHPLHHIIHPLHHIIHPLHHIIDPSTSYHTPPTNMNKRFEGHKLGSITVMARPGWTTPDQQWRPKDL